MKSSKKIIIKLFTLYILLATSVMLGGCSTIYDAVMWAPRTLWNATGDKWFGVHNDQQTDMGPRRKPLGNPQGGGSVPGYPAVQKGNMGIAPVFPQGDASVASPQSNNSNYEYQPKTAMPTTQNAVQADANTNSSKSGNYPSLSASGSYADPNYKGGGSAQNNGSNSISGAMPPMPAIPPEYMQSYTGGKSSQPQKMPGDFQAPDMSGIAGADSDGPSADAAFASGGANSGEKSKGWSIPFLSGNYKIERKFEPLSEEFVVSQAEVENIDPAFKKKDSGGQVSSETNLDKRKSRRASSMFPLEQYAPKPTGEIKKMESKEQPDSYPKLGHVPESPKDIPDVKASAAEINQMNKEAEDMQEKKAGLSNPPQVKGDGSVYPNMKVKEGPSQIPEKNNNAEKPQSGTWDKVPLVRRRDAPQSSNTGNSSGKESAALAAGALKGDATIMKEISPDNKNIQTSANQNQPEKGFFASLHDRFFKPSPKQVWRKSEPPKILRGNDSSGNGSQSNYEPVVEQNLPTFNMPDKMSANEQKSGFVSRVMPDSISLDHSGAPSGKNYAPTNGSLLPKSNDTDRRRVPQQD